MARVNKHLRAILMVCSITGKTVDEISKWDTVQLYKFLAQRGYVWRTKSQKWSVAKMLSGGKQIPVFDAGVIVSRFFVHKTEEERIIEEVKLGFELLGYSMGKVETKPARYNSFQVIVYVTFTRNK